VKILQSDYTKPVTAELVNQAIQTIILNRPTHIDSLLERLNEDRVRKIIEPMILGDGDIDKQSDDFQYTKDLGLICVENSRVKPSNPIYAEVIIRKLSFRVQDELQDPAYPYAMSRYMNNGCIDMDFLMDDFQKFWRKNSKFWLKRLDYIEAVPHLVLMGFLQRVVNGGGRVTREVSSGTGRLDLCIEYENRQYPIELKIRYREKYVEKGLETLAGYMDTLGCDEGWMVVFDRRKTVKWENKIYSRKETVDGKTITVVGA
jgi:hypothetical protein